MNRKKFTIAGWLALLTLVTNSNAAPIQWSVSDGGNGHYYEWVELDSTITWHDANTYAQSLTFNGMNGYLASITSEAENLFIASNFNASGFLSGNDYEINGIWVWEGGPDDGIVFQTGFGQTATRTTSFLSIYEPNGDGNFLWYFATGNGYSWINDAEGYRGGAFIEYSGVSTPVPLPPAFFLFGSGLIGFSWYRKKQVTS